MQKFEMKKRLQVSALSALIVFAFLLLGGCQKSGGPVIIECGGPAQFGCPVGMFCDLGNACGGFDAIGQCRVIPRNCPNEDEPVCGCNDKTYASPCYAHATGTSIAYGGTCIRREPPRGPERKPLEFPSTGSVRTGDVEGAGDVHRDNVPDNPLPPAPSFGFE